MRTIRLITEGAAARWPVVKNAEAEALGTVKKSPTKVLIKSSGLCKRLIKTMNENRDVTLFLVLCLVMRRKLDRKSTRLNSSHSQISYAVFCLKKKKI